MAQVPFQRDADVSIPAETERGRGRAVDSVRADQHGSVEALAAGVDRDALLPGFDRGHPDAVSKRGPGLSRAFGEKEVEPPALRQVDQRNTVAARDRAAVAQTQVDLRGDVLHHGLDRERE
jgi:hypothetical protein